MKKIFAITAILIAFLSACGSNEPDMNNIGTEPIPDATKNLLDNKPDSLETSDTHNVYTLFTINTHDWVHPEDSADTLNKIIDIHEEYDVPVDIYVSDPVFQNFVTDYPELVERLKTSSVVCVSFHLRPPSPYYSNFDYIGLKDMNTSKLYETLNAYEEHKLDLSTGLYFEDEPGGYQFVKDTIGYAPVITGISASGDIGQTLAKVYRDKGATFLVEHDGQINLGDTKYGSYLRPEDKEVKLYELIHDYTGGQDVFDMATADFTSEKDEFINFKYHENNFYLTETPFWPFYWTDSKKSQALTPPFDLNANPTDAPTYRSEQRQQIEWDLYENTVKFAGEHSSEFNPINAFDLKEML